MVSWNAEWQQAHQREESSDASKWGVINEIVSTPTPLSTMNFGPSLNAAYSSSLPASLTDNDFYPNTWTPPSWWSKYSSPTQWPLSTTLATSTFSHHTAESDQSSYSPTPTPIASEGMASPTTTFGNGGVTDKNPGLQQHQASHVPIYAAAAVIPIVVMAAVGGFIFLCMKKRRKQQQVAATHTQAQVQELKTRMPPTVSAYMAPPVAREPSYTAPPRHPPPQTPQPVILGPISAATSGNYFTGIDTSDAVSVRSNGRTGLGDPFADGSSLNEEPPPPYRPRSIAPLSRNTSLHSSNQQPPMSSQTYLISDRGEPFRSPFDDPRDDDEISVLSGPTLRRDRDDMSVVSDISYQQDPFANRHGA